MTAKFRSNNGPPPGTADWFLPAILHDGSVDTCLAQVENELSLKHEFILALRQALRGEEESGLDAITAISNEQKLVANSLRFRLGMLQPERVGAWFRPPVATTMGPFSSAMLREPVFGPYDLKHCGKVQAKLERAYEERRVDVLPFEDDSANLWRTVLTLNARLEQACRLPKPFQKYR